MNPEDVAQYLTDHPDFFNEHTDLLTDIYVPHPHDGKVVSLPERQMIALREKNKILQNKLLELINFGEENDAISEKMHRLTIALLAAFSFEEFLNSLNYSLKEDFNIPHFVLRLWNVKCKTMDFDEFTTTSEDIHAIAKSLTHPYCGNHVADAIKQLFDEGAAHLHSFSMIPLTTSQSIGLLVLASPETERFYADMGTVHLKRLGDLISTSVARYDTALDTDQLSQNEATDEQHN